MCVHITGTSGGRPSGGRNLPPFLFPCLKSTCEELCPRPCKLMKTVEHGSFRGSRISCHTRCRCHGHSTPLLTLCCSFLPFLFSIIINSEARSSSTIAILDAQIIAAYKTSTYDRTGIGRIEVCGGRKQVHCIRKWSRENIPESAFLSIPISDDS